MIDDGERRDDSAEDSVSGGEPGPAACWAADPEVAPPPDYSIVAEERLVAYVWEGDGGELRRTGNRAHDDPVALGFGDLLLFEGEHAETLRELAVACDALDRLRFKVELEGWSWLAGAAQPHARARRF